MKITVDQTIPLDNFPRVDMLIQTAKHHIMHVLEYFQSMFLLADDLSS
jgi:hypothetical protein